MPYKNRADKNANGRRWSKSPKGRRAWKRYYKKNKQKIVAKNQKWTAANKDKVNAAARRRSHTLEGRYKTLLENAKRRKIKVYISFEQYRVLVSHGRCHYDNRPLPKAGGGLDRQNHKLPYRLDNVVTCCSSCNEKKGALEMIGFTYPRTVLLLLELVGQNR